MVIKKLNTTTDHYGNITIAVFMAEAPVPTQPAQSVTASVDTSKGFVCIGGGGTGSVGPPGALLTASFPDDPQTMAGWTIRTKEHLQPDPNYRAKAYAIGMTVKDFTHDQLKDNIKYFSGDSLNMNWPVVTQSIGDDYSLLGGGFEVHYNTGNFGFATFPESSFSWCARSKDMATPDPCTVTVYAIGIKTKLSKKDANGQDQPTGAEVITSFQSSNSSFLTNKAASHPEATAKLTKDYILCGGGAEVHWTMGSTLGGNYLWSLEPPLDQTDDQPPPNQSFIARSKDHFQTDLSTITTYAMGIKMRV